MHVELLNCAVLLTELVVALGNQSALFGYVCFFGGPLEMSAAFEAWLVSTCWTLEPQISNQG
jgi:hypothetical protein